MQVKTKPSICICGGGNISHAIASYAGYKGFPVTVYSTRPGEWGNVISASLPDDQSISGKISNVSNVPSIVSNADIIFITVPKFAVATILEHIGPHLSKGQVVAAIPGGPGFDWMTRSLVDRGVDVLGFQRVPFIARIEKYGESVHILGFKKELKVAALPKKNFAKHYSLIAEIFDTPVVEVSSFLAITLNNSNPILHPARITTMFSGWLRGVTYQRNYLFYEEWDDKASEALIYADNELMQVCRKCPSLMSDVVPICEYYNVSGTSEMTKKIRSISAFKGIASPMIESSTGWVPDLLSRYFTEDISFGTVPIKAISELANVRTPVIDSFIEWLQLRTGKRLIHEGLLIHHECIGLPIPQNYGYQSFNSLAIGL